MTMPRSTELTLFSGPSKFHQTFNQTINMNTHPHTNYLEVFPLIDRYAGHGGADLGSTAGGMHTMLAIDKDRHSVETFRLNHPQTPMYKADVTLMGPEETLELARVPKGKEFVYLTTPPCQGASKAGKCDPYHPLNRLMLHEPWFIAQVRPVAFVFENVDGLQYRSMGKLKAMLALEVQKHLSADYEVRECVLNAAHYHTPTDRKRYIMIGIRKDVGIIPTYPEPSMDIVGVKDVLPYIEAIAFAYGYRKLRSAERPINTITKTENVRKVVNGVIEKLTIDELKVLCGYPADWKTIGSWNQNYQRFGNSVMPPFAKAIFQNLYQQLVDAGVPTCTTDELSAITAQTLAISFEYSQPKMITT